MPSDATTAEQAAPPRRKEPQEAINKRHQKLKERREAAGLKRCEVWAKPEHHPAIKAFAKTLGGENDGR